MLILFGSFSFYFFEPRLGVDLIGGQLLEVKTKTKVKEIVRNLGIKAEIFETQEVYLIKSREDLTKLWQEIKTKDPQAERLKFESISPSLSSELRQKSFLMVILVLLAIGVYVAFAFYSLRKFFSLSSLALIVIFTLFHDVMVTTGFFVLLAKYLNFDLDIKFITALLIVAGFSVHDTIVVFDRLRENILKTNQKNEETFNSSINQTLKRSIFTSLTTILAILPLTFFLQDLRVFLLTLQIGILVGTYSSVCLAVPLLYDFKTK